ncbi:MAG: hypothetical protein AAFP85_00930 [Pseudomonadota bacterium]
MKLAFISVFLWLGLLEMGPAMAQTMSTTDRNKLTENVAKADANGDGAFSADEFRQLIDLNAADGLGQADRIRRAGLYDRAFRRLDADGDGLLTRQEMLDTAPAADG